MFTSLSTTLLSVLQVLPLSMFMGVNCVAVFVATAAVLVVSAKKNPERTVWPFVFCMLGHGAALAAIAPVILDRYT